MGGDVKLAPLVPPGRITRKARDFGAEIVQLRAQGYTLGAIRQALAGAGVQVSISTVRREATRHAAQTPVVARVPQTHAAPPVRTPEAPATSGALVGGAGPTVLTEQPTGRDLAEAFMRTQSTNPLIRAKEHQ